MEPILMARIAALLAGCALAAYTDAKTGLILDKITYPMIALGIALNLLEFNWLFLGIGTAVFAIGYVVYYMGKLGGGDVKLFTATAFLLPFFQGSFFLLNSLFAACILAVSFYSTYYVARYARQGINWQENRAGIWKALLFGVAIAGYFCVASFLGVFAWQSVAVLALPLFLAVLFLAFEKGIRHRFFLQQVRLSQLEEDEVIAAEFLDKALKKKLGLKAKGVFGEREIERLKLLGVKKAPVYRGMPPFAPFILLGCIVAILLPDLLGLLFT